MDLWPTFWTKIAQMINAGDVLSNIQVKGEIDKGGDELTDWMRHNVPARFYIGNDADVMVRYGEVINFLLYCLIAGMSLFPVFEVMTLQLCYLLRFAFELLSRNSFCLQR